MEYLGREIRLSTAGKQVCPARAKNSVIELSLASSIAKLYGFIGFRVVS
jgi:hypothetical protein